MKNFKVKFYTKGSSRSLSDKPEIMVLKGSSKESIEEWIKFEYPDADIHYVKEIN